MASCSLGASTNSILPNLLSSFKKIKCSGSDAPFKFMQVFLNRVLCIFIPTLGLMVAFGLAENDIEVGALEEKQSNGNELIPSSPEVESLLNVICDTTSIAECELNMFQERSSRYLGKDGEPVGYGDDLIAILPSFPGIKKLQ
ncbi:hypothetical protein J5N97_004049 [Dioscorea zingiberensis]|uniref:Uncharacterized protein n=1 Tax=Dioscorea zingiberensis TaxID=325984 RepID=A0A9D5D5X1_9LILI|nr:hypothetical protein J5N97_004049 [Dioscorea zingiberensis]